MSNIKTFGTIFGITDPTTITSYSTNRVYCSNKEIYNDEPNRGMSTINNCRPKLNVTEIINNAINDIEKVIFHDSATIIIWGDGTKTVVKCNDLDTFSYEAGIAFAIVKKVLGNKSNYNNVIRKLIDNAIEY